MRIYELLWYSKNYQGKGFRLSCRRADAYNTIGIRSPAKSSLYHNVITYYHNNSVQFMHHNNKSCEFMIYHDMARI